MNINSAAHKRIILKRINDVRKLFDKVLFTEEDLRESNCLRCNKLFLSEGPQNRMCDYCRSQRTVDTL